ncbi:MAG: imidazoleglycerol-phosphate dehydratase, partial [Polyangiales bacterium]
MSRKAELTRTTQETDIRIELDLDGCGRHDIKTPLPFLTHMVEQLSRHGLFDLKIDAKGDIEIDGHHTTEDLGITLGR